MFCHQCKTKKPNDPSTKKWCTECRKAASKQVKAHMKARPKRLYGGHDYASRDLILKELGFASYRDYLSSPLWSAVRARVFKIKGHHCYLCGEPAYAIHHNRYHRNDLLGRRLKFIHPICRRCHERIEFDADDKKVTVSQAKRTFRRARKEMLRQMREREYDRHIADLMLRHEGESADESRPETQF